MPRHLNRLLAACLLATSGGARVPPGGGGGGGGGSSDVEFEFEGEFEVRLASDVADVGVDFGLVVAHANTISADPTLAPPPGNYTKGSMIVAAFRSLDAAAAPGTYEVYVTNSTGNIPLAPRERDGGMCLYRWITSDFRAYRGGECALWLPNSDGLGDVKTITRDDATGTYYLIWWGPGQRTNGGAPYLKTSRDHGASWSPKWAYVEDLDHYNPPGTTIHTKDDINLLYQPGVGLVDCQMWWQKNTSACPAQGPPSNTHCQIAPYCDNGGCDKRRVLGALTGDDAGTSWTFHDFHESTRMPGVEADDPPELQFYRMRPALVPGTRGTRVFAHVLLYAPSPYIGPGYGRQPSDCSPSQHQCHGPHMYEEWWTLPAGASAANLTAWRRPARFTRMAPENAYLFAQPGLVGTGAATRMVWVGSGAVYTLPLHRAVGLYAPANARVTLPAFDLSAATAATRLFLNADAHWGSPLLAGGCDETCAAYVLVELEDSATGNTIEGYDRASFNAITNQSAINIPLLWNNSSRLPLGHGNVTVKVWFRAAKVYAVYLGERFGQ
jgi:hypothetical protein